MFKRCLLASALVLSACSQVSDETEPAQVAQLTMIDVADLEVLHGATPNDYKLSWTTTGDPDGKGVSVFVSNDPVDPEPTKIAENVTDGTLDWSAAGEAKRRYFTVSGSNLANGVSSAVRLLPLEGGRNFRDLGGYPTKDGKTVKWGQIFRSGVMHELTQDDYSYLSSLGVQVICDFRDKNERDREPTVWGAGDIDYLTFSDPEESDQSENPMFAALMSPTATPEDVAESMAEGYVHIAKDEAEGYKQMFDRLAAGEIPLAFNCSAGKDRAGTAAALILTALGVPKDIVVHDYSLSDDYVDYMAAFMNDEAREAAANDPENPYAFLFKLPIEKVEPLLESRPMYIEASLNALEREFGSVMAFIQNELDVSDTELASIRSALLE